MLHLPEGSSTTVKLVGIDPGSSNLGFAWLEYDLITKKIVRTRATTFNGVKLIKQDTWAVEMHGEKASRIKALKEKLLQNFLELRPIQIVCEGAFFNQLRPNAFEVLIEVRIAIKEAISMYDCWRTIYLIDPPTVKKGVKAPGNAKKDVIKQCVLALPDLCFEGEVALSDLDEHAIDALAIVYTRYQQLISE